MKKQLLKRAMIILIASGLLIANNASAIIVTDGYWGLTEVTAGSNGTAGAAIKVNNLFTQDVSFGLFSYDGVTKTNALVFAPNMPVGTDATLAFTFDGSDWDLNVHVNGAAAPTYTYDNFGNTFGFYLGRTTYTPGAIYSDPTFDTPATAAANFMQIDYNSILDVALVSLWLPPERIGGVATMKYQVKVDDVAPVPEPTTMLLFGAGLMGLAGIARKKKS